MTEQQCIIRILAAVGIDPEYWDAPSMRDTPTFRGAVSWLSEYVNEVVKEKDVEIEGLKKEVARLSLFERAIASLASQFICPVTTPEEFARDVLKEKVNGR